MTSMEKLKNTQKEYNAITGKRRKLGKKIKYMGIEDKKLEKEQFELLKKIETLKKELGQ